MTTKYLHILYMFFLSGSSHIAKSEIYNDDEKISKLEVIIKKRFEVLKKEIPEDIRKNIMECESSDDLIKTSEETQLWMHQELSGLGDNKIAEIMGRFTELRLGEDWNQVLSEAFWCELTNRPMDLKSKIQEIGSYWEEHSMPQVEFAPRGQGRINWLWKLEVKTRVHGILHVGIDLTTREFVCFENTLGIYYPMGETLERIRSEIVQDPNMANDFIGKGYLSRIPKQIEPNLDGK